MGVNGTLDLCLGSPAFDAKAGEVIFAGGFDFTAEHFGPELDLEDSRLMLKNFPDLGLRLQAADYVNGTTAECLGSTIYAFEIAGSPAANGQSSDPERW